MFNIATLKTALSGYIGFRYPVDDAVTIATALRTSVSGQYWDDFHPLLNPDTIFSTAPQWANFSTWLGQKIDSSISLLFNRLATNKKLQGSTKSLFDNKQLFTGVGKITDQVAKSSRLVGLAISPKIINNIQVTINQIGLQLTSAQPGLPIYLWHSSRVVTVDSQVLVTSGTNYFDWQSLNWNLDYVNYANDIDSGGRWYIGYYEADLTGNAIRKTYDFYAGPCVTCRGTEIDRTIYDLWSRYVNVMPFYVEAGKFTGQNLPSVENMIFDETNNFGLNLALTVKPEMTELITSNLQLITYPLGLQFANDMLEWMLFNPGTRINPQQENARSAIAYALDGSENKKGIREDLKSAIDALAVDLSGVSAALPQNRPSGISIGVI